MKHLATIIIITLAFAVLIACGSGGEDPSDIDPATPPQLSNIVGFTCLSVDNNQVCTGVQDALGVWDSGPVAVTGDPPPDDWINIEVTNNNMAVNATVFVYSLVTIKGCGDNPIAFDAQTLAPGDTVTLDYRLWNYRCGWYGDQQTDIQLYNVVGFDPADYANPWTYPRTHLIANAVVRWDNRIQGDMP